MRPKLSIVIPVSDMPNQEAYLWRCINSITSQTFTDYEVIPVRKGRAAETQNEGIRRARGEYIKLLHMDDYFSTPLSLQRIVDYAPFEWLVTNCVHDLEGQICRPHSAEYTDDIYTGNNRIGAPSVITFRNGLDIYFDEDLDWLYDTSFYKDLYDKCGPPIILNDYNVIIGLHPGQLTHQIPNEQKIREVELMKKKYEKN